MITARVNPSSILLRDGDLVRVCAVSDAKVFVPGEVPRQATLTLTGGRRIQVKRLVTCAASGARRILARRRGPAVERRSTRRRGTSAWFTRAERSVGASVHDRRRALRGRAAASPKRRVVQM